jgi:hypothetical protein
MDQTFKLLTTVTFKPGGVFYLHFMILWSQKTGVPEDKIHGFKGFYTTLLFNYQRSVFLHTELTF